VNVAARLQGLAEPGGICISQAIHAAVGRKLDLMYQDIGLQQVKNIAERWMARRHRQDQEAAVAAAPL
jgi:adenylate cyclase